MRIKELSAVMMILLRAFEAVKEEALFVTNNKESQ